MKSPDQPPSQVLTPLDGEKVGLVRNCFRVRGAVGEGPDLLSPIRQLDDALAAQARAESAMSLSEGRFFSVDVALGLEVAPRQTPAALPL